MREGTVVYLAGAKELDLAADVEGALAGAGFDPAWTEVSAPGAGYYTPQRAALELVKRGAAKVTLRCAWAKGDGTLAVSASRARLAG